MFITLTETTMHAIVDWLDIFVVLRAQMSNAPTHFKNGITKQSLRCTESAGSFYLEAPVLDNRSHQETLKRGTVPV